MSLISSAGLPTDEPITHSLMIFKPLSWLVTNRRSGTLRLIPVSVHIYRRYHTAPLPHPVLPYNLARPAHHERKKYITDTFTAADLRCIIAQGIQKWFLTGDTNEPDNAVSNRQVPSPRRLPSSPVERSTCAFLPNSRTYISSTPLATTTSTRLALALDGQHNNEGN
jgi:hypothetical protein